MCKITKIFLVIILYSRLFLIKGKENQRDNKYTIDKNISLCNTLYAKTSSLQMLYYMKQSIDNLNETLKTGKGNCHKEKNA